MRMGYTGFGPDRKGLPPRPARARRPARPGASAGRGVGTKPPTIDALCNPEFLMAAYRKLSDGGQAAGPDGITYTDLSPSEVWEILRAVAREIKAGTWRPGASREKQIPKAGGKGYRTLKLANIVDRVVGRALADLMTPTFEKAFLPNSVGFRPGRNVHMLLAALAIVMPARELWVIAQDDIKNAFDHVPIDTAVDLHRKYTKDPRLLTLVELVLRGGRDTNRKEGIAQGDPYSPLVLNLLTHHILDLPAEQLTPYWARYADNLVYLARSLTDGAQALRLADDLLCRNGMTLKRVTPPADLHTGDQVEVLGFTLSCNEGKLNIDLGTEALTKLEAGLAMAHQTEDPSQTADSVVTGWVHAYGPAIENGNETVITDQILRTAARTGHRELDPDRIHRAIQKARTAWTSLRKRAETDRTVLKGILADVPAPPPPPATARPVANVPASTDDRDKIGPASADRSSTPADPVPTRPVHRRPPPRVVGTCTRYRSGRAVIIIRLSLRSGQTICWDGRPRPSPDRCPSSGSHGARHRPDVDWAQHPGGPRHLPELRGPPHTCRRTGSPWSRPRTRGPPRSRMTSDLPARNGPPSRTFFPVSTDRARCPAGSEGRTRQGRVRGGHRAPSAGYVPGPDRPTGTHGDVADSSARD